MILSFLSSCRVVVELSSCRVVELSSCRVVELSRRSKKSFIDIYEQLHFSKRIESAIKPKVRRTI